ncbi:ATP-binding protein [Pseudomonas sp. 10B1]|uniref:ATP-binding protein n=1 Tax=unclassified Pseudomonas TaxID=196821 RepID=UPI002AB490F2|nr:MULTISPECIES: ATP-binding protein [unclassified Pseudomonas]MDY7559405.1 ATP-binding protein [Pseudomonas sp. AB6]MEA9996625.1 ATP-binding protein [Pseudomonas sp. AA4]MEB0087924.1 ATP-binding protein [Pseudomonas sp. RTI1]MEB0128133.1 ATP-binding protein [Pseudomonas sp. CCC1.2]MEB0155528.1 ATP-binding protein [Pseudomonas sp. CCC4.3]
MSKPHGSQDTIVSWIALTIAAAMIASLGLYALFIQAAGVWSRPSLEQIGLLDQAAAITRIIDAAPVQLRPKLASAASNPLFTVSWYAQHSSIGAPLKTGVQFTDAIVIQRLTSSPQRRVEAYGPQDWPKGDSLPHYMLAVQLTDATWLAFVAPERTWGLSQTARNAVLGLLGLIAALSVAWFATRRLAAPLRRFAHAAKRFGGDFHSPAITPEGPYEIRQAIIAFNAMQAQIRHFVTDRTQMLAAISHDLRAPLTRMRLRGEFIEDEEQQRKLFRDVDEMQSMITSALEFFRDDARLETATAFDLSELIQTLIDDYRDQGVTVDFSGPSKQVYFGRPLGIKRVVTNLLENTIKYAVAPRIDLTQSETSIIIEVTDSGPGIPQALLEKVFEPFFRLEASRNRNTGGVGLGLSAARAIVLEHGGELRLYRRLEGGTIARASLPKQ